jgi:Glycosyltransferase family 87
MARSETKVVKRMAAFVLLGVTAWVLYSRLSDAPVVDLVEYWSAAQILRHGGNPYSPEQMLVVERTSGWSHANPLLMWNPPWTLPFVLPMAWLSYRTSYLLWALLNIVIVVCCADVLWFQFGGTPKRRFVAWLIALTFVPTITVIHLGQIGPLMLLGITTFLIWYESRPFLAGMATLCIALKPQLLYLFWIVLGLWAIRDKRWRVLAGALIAFGAATLVSVCVRPTIFADYVAQFRAADVLANPSPNLGTLLRWSFSSTTWLQFVPSVAGAVWLLWYWMKTEEWEWSREISLLLLVSLVTTSYGWLFDQVTLLPALMQAVVVMQERSNALRSRIVTASYLLINAGIILSIRVHAVGVAYVWVAPAWLALYLLVLSPLREGHGRELVRR